MTGAIRRMSGVGADSLALYDDVIIGGASEDEVADRGAAFERESSAVGAVIHAGKTQAAARHIESTGLCSIWSPRRSLCRRRGAWVYWIALFLQVSHVAISPSASVVGRTRCTRCVSLRRVSRCCCWPRGPSGVLAWSCATGTGRCGCRTPCWASTGALAGGSGIWRPAVLSCPGTSCISGRMRRMWGGRFCCFCGVHSVLRRSGIVTETDLVPTERQLADAGTRADPWW